MRYAMIAIVACLLGCGGVVSSGGAGGCGGEGGAPACLCDCEPTAPSTHPLAYCEDPAHDGLTCCLVDGGRCTGGECLPAQ